MEKKWAFILNPTAGNGFAGKYVDTVKEKIKQFNVDAELVFTKEKGHAEKLSQEFAKQNFDYIIAIGGDGTLNEIARPLINNKNVTIGIIPAGTGNDFVQIVGFPDRFEEEHWKKFFEVNTINMDVGTCNGTYFLNGMGLGFDAEVAAQNYTGEDGPKKGGKDKYIWHIIKTLLFFREKQAIIETNDKKEETSCFMNTIANGRRFAGDFFITPQAIANDGLFDICMIRKLNLRQRLKILLDVPKGAHITDEKVHYYKTDKLTLEFTERQPFHVDGEMFFASKFEVKILPEAVNMIFNPTGKHYFKIPE